MWTCIKCNAVNEDTYTICPKCGAARSAGRFGSGNAAPARNAAAYTAPVQQRVMPSANLRSRARQCGCPADSLLR